MDQPARNPRPTSRYPLSSILYPLSSILRRNPLTKAGRYFVLVALVLLGIGVHRDINLLMLLGYALLMMALGNVLAAGRSLRGLHAQRRLGEWLFARTPCSVEVQISNDTQRTQLGLRMEDGGPDHAATWMLDRLPGLGRRSWRRDVAPPRRGRHTWGALWASSSYPFGLVERQVLLAAEESVVILPRLGWLHRGRFLRHLRTLSVQPRQASVRNRPQTRPVAQAEFHGLRCYQSGDSPRLIHWRTSARRGQLMVREFEEEPSDNLLLLIDPTLPAESDYAGVPLREQFEEAVSLAATICWEWCRRRDDQLVLAASGADPQVLAGLTGPAHARRILECLALLECVPGPSDPAVIRRLPFHRLPSTIVVLVAMGRSALMEPLRRALGRRVHELDATRTDEFDFYVPPQP